MRVLGIETSCDETGVAVYDTAFRGAEGLRAQAVYSQIALHAEYGGVVPELASRDHVRKLLPLVREALKAAGMTPADLDLPGLGSSKDEVTHTTWDGLGRLSTQTDASCTTASSATTAPSRRRPPRHIYRNF